MTRARVVLMLFIYVFPVKNESECIMNTFNDYRKFPVQFV